MAQIVREVFHQVLELQIPLSIPDVLQIPPNAVLELRRNLRLLHIFRNISHLLSVLALLQVDLLQRRADRVHGEREHTTSDQQKYQPERSFDRRAGRDVPVADSRHGGHSPVKGIGVPD